MTKHDNAKRADGSATFRKACELAGIPPTRRQWSKWKRRMGKANQYRGKVDAT